MRTERYREVARELQEELREWGEVEKTSYDDFYLDISALVRTRTRTEKEEEELELEEAAGEGEGAQRDDRLFVVGDLALSSLPLHLRRACGIARQIREKLSRRMGMSVSVGVGGNKLQARLVSGLHKPSAITLLPAPRVPTFMQTIPLTQIPSLRGKLGRSVCEALGVRMVGELAQVERRKIEQKFGEEKARFLCALPMGGRWEDVKDRGGAKSMLVERSCPPAPSPAHLRALLSLLSRQLVTRWVEEERSSSLPAKLVVHVRREYESMRSKSVAVPPLISSLQRMLGREAGSCPGGEEDGARSRGRGAEELVLSSSRAVEEAAMQGIAKMLLPHPWNVTRVAVAFLFETGVGKTGGARAGRGFGGGGEGGEKESSQRLMENFLLASSQQLGAKREGVKKEQKEEVAKEERGGQRRGDAVKTIMEMGFAKDAAEKALERGKGGSTSDGGEERRGAAAAVVAVVVVGGGGG
eukprot:756631-Hanusia_phi.AAC.4